MEDRKDVTEGELSTQWNTRLKGDDVMRTVKRQDYCTRCGHHFIRHLDNQDKEGKCQGVWFDRCRSKCRKFQKEKEVVQS